MKLNSEEVVISAPTSFSGSAARIWKMTDSENAALKWLLLVPIALCLIFMAWSLVRFGTSLSLDSLVYSLFHFAF